ncbi:MAG: hypothetical protein QGH47_00155 [Candidatus Woesearchaeota archaeon]|jgi:hypothetical protein|nr:hypothetical protein [Candidatus Woesearchaeota archaeon]
MGKRGQISLFLIVVLVLLIGTSLTLYLFQSSAEQELEESLGTTAASSIDPTTFKQSVENCLRDRTLRFAELIALRGGSFQKVAFNPFTPGINTGVVYQNTRYRYFCKQEDGKGCVNVLLTRKDMETELNIRIREHVLEHCIDFRPFASAGYDVETGDFGIDTKIAVDVINVRILYPTFIRRGDLLVNIPEYFTKVEFPLGRLYDLAVFIVNNQVAMGTFNKDDWMEDHGSDIRIKKQRPYPDTVYKLIKELPEINKVYEFNFALQGDSTVTKLQSKIAPDPYKFCDMGQEKNCFVNVNPQMCINEDGTSTFNPRHCDTSTIFGDSECEGGQCKDCTKHGKDHGETWCFYDGLVGEGQDRVGTRHYKQSCQNGKIYTESCRDYREGLCTLGPNGDRAVCRPNKWEDCLFQPTKNACEDDSLRDCYWADWLNLENDPGYQRLKPIKSHCFPQVPPGFKFWDNLQRGEINAVCQMANEITRFTQPVFAQINTIRPPNKWVNSAALYCASMGDCGNKRNILGFRVTGQYHNANFLIPPNPQEADGVYGPPMVNYLDALFLRNDVFTRRYGVVYIPRPTAQEADQFSWDFFNMARGWKACKGRSWCRCRDRAFKCKRYFGCGPCGPKQPVPANYLRWLDAYAICEAWKPTELTGGSLGPPDYGIPDTCAYCTQEAGKPCTEYRCRSLGKNCRYHFNATTGKGVCSDDTNAVINLGPLRLRFNKTRLDPKYHAIDTDFSDYPVHDIRPEIQPMEEFVFEMSTNREAFCEASILPNQNVGGKFSGLGVSTLRACGGDRQCFEILDDGTRHTVRFRLKSDEAFRKRTLELLNFTTLLQATIPGAGGFQIDGIPIPEFDTSVFLGDALGIPADEAQDFLQDMLLASEARRSVLFFRCIDENSVQNTDNVGISFMLNITDTERPVVNVLSIQLSQDPAFIEHNISVRFTANDDSDDLDCFINAKSDLEEDQVSIFMSSGGTVENKVSVGESGAYSVKVICSDGVNEGRDGGNVDIDQPPPGVGGSTPGPSPTPSPSPNPGFDPSTVI